MRKSTVYTIWCNDLERAKTYVKLINKDKNREFKIPETEKEATELLETKEMSDYLVEHIERELTVLLEWINIDERLLEHMQTDHANECCTCMQNSEDVLEVNRNRYNIFSHALSELKRYIADKEGQ